MTSKEALESLMKNYYEMCVIDNCNDDMYQKFNNSSERGIIEKDLEVLEHLKQLFYGIKVLEAIGVKYTDMYDLIKNSDDNLIKEWLENESNND